MLTAATAHQAGLGAPAGVRPPGRRKQALQLSRAARKPAEPAQTPASPPAARQLQRKLRSARAAQQLRQLHLALARVLRRGRRRAARLQARQRRRRLCRRHRRRRRGPAEQVRSAVCCVSDAARQRHADCHHAPRLLANHPRCCFGGHGGVRCGVGWVIEVRGTVSVQRISRLGAGAHIAVVQASRVRHQDCTQGCEVRTCGGRRCPPGWRARRRRPGCGWTRAA